jgi:predicted DsbA family dithiol-disulfide isomerase
MLKINLFSDIVCPWCIIGQYRLDKVLTTRFADLKVDIEHHPFELMPTAPTEGVRLEQYFRSKGIAEPRLAFSRPEAEARASGLDLDLARQTHVYRTIRAHTLLRHARDRGSQHDLSAALMRAYFLEARNISDIEVLADVASHYGFRTDETRSLVMDPAELDKTEGQLTASRTLGVRSVPTFGIGPIVIVGGRSEEEIASAISQALAA